MKDINFNFSSVFENNNSKEPKKSKEFLKKVSTIFDNVGKIDIPEEKRIPQREKKIKNITSKNLNSLESVDIKEDWEKIKLPKKANLNNYLASNSIIPSRGQSENYYGGTGDLRRLSGNHNTFDNPNAIENYKESKYTKAIIKDSNEKKQERILKKQKPRDWEKIEKAKSTSEIHPTQMGFTPNRTAFKPQPLPKVNIAGLSEKDIERKKKEGKRKNHLAFKLQEKLNKAMMDNFNKELNDNRNWEEKIAENMQKKQDSIKSNTKGFNFSSNDIDLKSLEKNKDKFSGLFSVAESPKEKNIKREIKHLAQERKSKKEDRSWETLENLKAKKRTY